ncbi:MAG: TonB-dependent receptor [Bacteroidia bacterium]|nr:TonB-dependent receptor [Bacteroidia bacterium]
MKSTHILYALLLCVFSPALLFAQNSFDVKGKVVDVTGQPLTGVNITEKSLRAATISDIDGNFVLKNLKAESILTVSFIGFVTQEIKIANQRIIDIQLIEESRNLNEVMVVAYGTQKKVSLTGAISSISGNELLKSPSANIGNSLSGAVSGLSSVQMSGKPGGDAAKIFVRGISSLTEGVSLPLILVDGVERDFNQLDPNEIESITVLKDASATAVFGVRGANGVIITEGKTSISVKSSLGSQIPTRLMKMANSFDYASAKNELDRNDGVPENLMLFSPAVLDHFKNNTQPIMYPSLDWRKELMKSNAFQTQHNITISGGDKRVKYFASLGYFNQDGLFKTYNQGYNSNFTFQRINYRTNLDIKVSNTSTVKINLGGRTEIRNEPNITGNFWQELNWSAPMATPGIINGKLILPNTNKLYSTTSLNDPYSDWYGAGFNNYTKNTLNFDFVFSQNLDVVTKGLSTEVKASYNGTSSLNLARTTSEERLEPWFRCDFDPSALADSTVIYRIKSQDGELGYSESYGKGLDWYAEMSLRYNRTFGKSEVTGLLLYNQSKYHYPSTYSDIAHGYVGLVGRATYSYANKYLAELNAGYNGSENFAPESRYGLFPSVSLGWILTQERFMKSIKWLSYLKFRASVGLVGNDQMGGLRFLYLPDTYTANSGNYNFGVDIPTSQLAAMEATLGNRGVRWETALKQNYAVDFSVLREKMTVSIDLFRERREGILRTRSTVPGIIQASLPAMNFGIVENGGYETSVKWNDKVGAMRYWLLFNYSYAKNNIIFMDEVEPDYAYMRRTGRPVGTRFGRVFYDFYKADVTNEDGSITKMTYPDGTPVAISTDTPIPKPGDAVYYDLNADGKIDQFDETVIGIGNNPRSVFGLKMGGELKGFELSLLWSAATQVDRMFGTAYQKPFDGVPAIRGIYQFQLDGRWTPATADQAIYPRLSYSAAKNNYAASDLWVKDASYIRLKNIEIAYTFNKSFLKKLGIQQLRLFANGYNLLTFDKLKLIDPEERTDDYGDYPLLKVINVGMNINF